MTEWIRLVCSEMKKSRFKIWLRAVLFVLFGMLFTFSFRRDIASGHFTWTWSVMVFMLLIPAGFGMSRIVHTQVDRESRAVTFSLDRVCLILIRVLVITKLIASHIPRLVSLSDVIMSAILGIMIGRPGGSGLRVQHQNWRMVFSIRSKKTGQAQA
jgi:hypothetical protein